ncbi:MAG: hypothetical protein IT340_23085 [Chloroflexi bacterium]|nr:hypothetical protein [Chloroflexota bacterium]
MSLNVRPNQRQTILATIDPVSQGAGTVTTGWVSMRDVPALQAILQTGVLGASATVDAKLQQATDSGGTGAKDVTGSSITQLTKAGSDDNKQVVINMRGDALDVTNSFTHVRLSVTVGTAASLIAAMVLGVDAHYQPIAAKASVKQVVTV